MTNEERTKYFSTFSGIGGFEVGIERATKAECVGFSEIDKYAVQIYQRHFPDHTNFGDITKINADELPDFDLLVGGFPCQAFSIAGKRGGFADTRGTLFFDLARILKAKRPRLFLFENVKGLLSHDEGRTFYTIVATLDELGYDVQWEVLNSKNFGVPQNRERIFIAGHLRGEPRPQVFPLGEDGGADNELSGHHTNTLTARYEGAQATGSYIGEGELDAQIHQLNQPKHSNDRVYGADGVAPTLNTMQGGNRQPFVAELKYVGSVGTPRKGSEHQPHLSRAHKQPARVYHEDGINPALSAGEMQGRYNVQTGMAIRRLTPIECERLQGYPDGWTEGVSDTQRYKTLGNSVTTNVIEAICERLLQ